MKTTALFLFFILSFAANAQVVNIPDPVFKQRLIDEGVDTNWDGEIQVSEAEAVTGTLDVNGQFEDIYDLTGIEAFINITGLDVWHNQLTTLDLSSNMALIELKCATNNLVYLNVENCINLEILMSYQNKLTELDLKNNIKLNIVHVQQNLLTNLDLRNNHNTNITSFTSSNNPNLTCIFVDDAEYSENSPVWFKDSTSTYVETEADCDAIGIENVFFQSMHIYPNPVKDVLYLEISESNNNIEIDIIDIKGKRNKIIKYLINNTKYQIDISHLQSGVYFVILRDQETKQTLTKKLIKL